MLLSSTSTPSRNELPRYEWFKQYIGAGGKIEAPLSASEAGQLTTCSGKDSRKCESAQVRLRPKNTMEVGNMRHKQH